MGWVSPPPWWRKSLCSCSSTAILTSGLRLLDPPKDDFPGRTLSFWGSCKGAPASCGSKSIIRGIVIKWPRGEKQLKPSSHTLWWPQLKNTFLQEMKWWIPIFNSAVVCQKSTDFWGSYPKSCFPFKSAISLIISRCVATDKGKSPFCLLEPSLLPSCFVIGGKRRPRELATCNLANTRARFHFVVSSCLNFH